MSASTITLGPGPFVVLALAVACAAVDRDGAASVGVAQSIHVEPSSSYNRKDWRLWIDADHDCQDTREEVLIAESEVPVTFKDKKHCTVARGRWTCPYTGETVTDPARLDIDHMVPLENANRSGGWRWAPEKKEAYANDLDEPEHLVAVIKSANRSKGSKGPEAWLPMTEGFRCEYVSQWRTIKKRWGLQMNTEERRIVEQILTDCGG
jgi:hypothetical protein